MNAQNIDAWIYDPSVTDPINNPPGNDILCLTMLDPLYEVPVTPAGSTPPFQAVAGSNERAYTEFLAGESPVMPNPADHAEQTVWHFFTVPPSGAIEMNIRAYIGMDTLRYAVYELLNGTDCYGGLNPATFTNDGTQLTPIITPVLTGSAGFSGTQEYICCMTPGSVYAIQLDGGSPGDEGSISSNTSEKWQVMQVILMLRLLMVRLLISQKLTQHLFVTMILIQLEIYLMVMVIQRSIYQVVYHLDSYFIPIHQFHLH